MAILTHVPKGRIVNRIVNLLEGPLLGSAAVRGSGAEAEERPGTVMTSARARGARELDDAGDDS